jgi:DNA-binding response OmpR family regulator
LGYFEEKMRGKQKTKETILIIDPEKPMIDLIKLTLGTEKYEYKTCQTIVTGTKHALESDFDLIITETLFPLGCGYKMIENIRKKKETPIMITSSRSQLVDKFKAINVGADDYISKPWSPEELVKVVELNIQ